MKIYREIRIDIDTGETLHEDSFEYDGPLALCGGDDGSSSSNDDPSDPGWGGGGGDSLWDRTYGGNLGGWTGGGTRSGSGGNAFTNPYTAKPGVLSDEAAGSPGAVGVGDDGGGGTEQSVAAAYSSPSAWDMFKDFTELVVRSFSTVMSAVSGDLVGVATQGNGALRACHRPDGKIRR